MSMVLLAAQSLHLIARLACTGVTFAFPHKHPTFACVSGARTLFCFRLTPSALRGCARSGTATLFALRTWRTSPLIRLAERKRLMPNACCGRLIPHRMPQYVRSRRTLHFSCSFYPLFRVYHHKQLLWSKPRCETPKCARDVPFSLCHLCSSFEHIAHFVRFVLAGEPHAVCVWCGRLADDVATRLGRRSEWTDASRFSGCHGYARR